MERKISINNILTPTFLYGTAWKEEQTERCVRDALNAGFRGIDTANQRKHYHEVGVGAALKKGYETNAFKRADLFLQTKFTSQAGQDQRLPYDPDADIRTQVMQSFASSLTHLHTDYIDSYVLHGPSVRRGLSKADWEVWRAMEELQQSGQVKLLGVSNMALDQLETLLTECVVKPSFVQNRCYARTGWDREVRAFCTKNGIHYQGFSLLTANTQIFDSPVVQTMINRYRCTPAQLIFRFALEVGMLPLTGATNPAHMREDLAVYDIKLEADDVHAIESIVE